MTVLDVRGISPITDYFVIGTGSSGRQMRSIAEDVEEMGGPRKFAAFGRNGYEGDSWLLADFVDVILHLFSPTARGFYDLEGLWGDAPQVDWQTGQPPPTNTPARPRSYQVDDEDEAAAAVKRYAPAADDDEDDADGEE